MGQPSPELFAADPAYDKFDILDTYPKGRFVPLHPRFAKRGHVTSGTKELRKYYVDLSIGECDCPKGYAFAWDNKQQRWYDAAYCTHKLRMLSTIVASETEPAAREMLDRAYLKALASRYNVWEVVSAFHKELRRGDFQQAWFWALILTTKRRVVGVFKYMLNIIYEETRDHDLGNHIMDVLAGSREITLPSLARTISWFCLSRKKWQLPRRYAIFTFEMRGYDKLAKLYGWDVAKGGNIIPVEHKDKLLKAMHDGAAKHDDVLFQFGLKGLQKLQYLPDCGAEYTKTDRDGVGLEQHRYWLFQELYALAEKLLPDEHDVWEPVAFVNRRINAGMEASYHGLNTIGDALMGEPADSGKLSATQRDIALKRPYPGIPLNTWPTIPLYGHDNHDYRGKALMRRCPEQLKSKAVQTDLDFRWCGAYRGVAYRYLAWKQYGNISEWRLVDWPVDIDRITNSTWY